MWAAVALTLLPVSSLRDDVQGNLSVHRAVGCATAFSLSWKENWPGSWLYSDLFADTNNLAKQVEETWFGNWWQGNLVLNNAPGFPSEQKKYISGPCWSHDVPPILKGMTLLSRGQCFVGLGQNFSTRLRMFWHSGIGYNTFISTCDQRVGTGAVPIGITPKDPSLS